MAKKQFVKVGATEKCPCGSGLIHLNCCLDRPGFEWVRNKRTGRVCNQMQLSPEMNKMFENMKKRQEEHLGRPLKASDKIFGDLTAEEATTNSVRALILADAHPQMIFVFVSVGIILSKENIPKLTTTDRAEILTRIHEYLFGEDRDEYLEQFREKFNDDSVFEDFVGHLNAFEDDPEEDMKDWEYWQNMLVDDSVRRMVQNDALKRKLRLGPRLN